MLPSGTLIYSLKFKKNSQVRNEFGEVVSTLVDIFKCKAAKVKQSGKFIVDGKELFNQNQVKFKIRINKLLTDNLTVEYDQNDYKITSLDKNLFDYTAEITLEKINK